MAKKAGLGRGLSALLGETETNIMDDVLPKDGDVIRIPIDAIDPNAEQPRKRFSEEALAQLATSIKSVGVLQPILVHKNGSRYTIIAGERRWRAARLAELDAIPAILRDMETTLRYEAALIENLQRDDLNPVEEAMAIRSLMEQCGYTQEAAAERIGRSRPFVANLLRLLSLPEDILAMLREGKLTAGHARALITLADESMQLKLAQTAAEQGWSVRQMEKACADAMAEKPLPKPKRVLPPEFVHLEHMARQAFGTKCKIDGNEKCGKVVLNYYSPEDLQRIWETIASMLPSE